MPLYRFGCESCGEFHRLAGYGIDSVLCACGSPATRIPTFEAGFLIAGRSIPTDPVEVQQEWFKEVRKAGWTGERAIEGIRKNAREDKEGHKFLDVEGMKNA